MRKIKILILGYSNFFQRRVEGGLKKFNNLNYLICSKSNLINRKKNIYFNSYDQALNNKYDMVYITLRNELHFKYAKKALLKGHNVVVDKPISLEYKQTRELLKLAIKKKLLLAEATLFNYHSIYDKIKKWTKNFTQIKVISANFLIPQKKYLSCLNDMSSYAVSIIRIFFNNEVTNFKIYKTTHSGRKKKQSFNFIIKIKDNTFFNGNFSYNKEYNSCISFFGKEFFITVPHQAFALPDNKASALLYKSKNSLKKTLIKDDCIYNFFNKIFDCLKKNNYKEFYRNIDIDNKLKKKLHFYE